MGLNDLNIYIRVSTKEQKENNTSLTTQRNIGIDLSKKLKINYKVWDEGSQSSFKDDLDNRGVLLELLSEVDKGKIKNLYVWNTDRLSRNQKVWGLIRYKLTQNNVKLYVGSDSNPIDLTDPMDSLLVGLLSEISSYDNKIRMERFRLGRINRVKNGFWYGGPPPYGYEIKEKRLVPNKYESEWVNFIFKNFNDGKSVNWIRKELFKNGVKSRRGNVNWNNGSIERLFKNTHYLGYYQMKDKKSGEVIKVDCSPIVPIKLINSVKQKREERSYRNGIGRIGVSNSRYDYLLKGLLECGYCGSKFGGTTSNTKGNHMSHYYCVRKLNNFKLNKTDSRYKECKKGRRSLVVNDCDNLVWNNVIDVIENSVLFKEEEKNKILESNNFKDNKDEIKKLEIRLKNTKKELDFVKGTESKIESEILLKKRDQKEGNLLLDNIITEKNKIIESIEGLENLIKGSNEKNEWIDWVNEFDTKIDKIRNETDLDIKKKFLNGLVDRIIVNYVDQNTHNLRVFFRIPFINDSLVWKDKGNKKLGYDIVKGKKSLYLKYELEDKRKYNKGSEVRISKVKKKRNV